MRAAACSSVKSRFVPLYMGWQLTGLLVAGSIPIFRGRNGIAVVRIPHFDVGRHSRPEIPPIGRCIYCGSDGAPDGLRDEHMVPYSLGSHAELQEASCRRCEQITSYIDGYLARHIFYDFRSHLGGPSRPSLPSALPANVSVGDREVTLNLPVKNRPFAVICIRSGRAHRPRHYQQHHVRQSDYEGRVLPRGREIRARWISAFGRTRHHPGQILVRPVFRGE